MKISGWKTDITVPHHKKSIICVAPHTSNWDFIIGLIAYRSIGRKANFLMKEFWFFFPLKYLLKALGGIPVKRTDKSGSLTNQLIDDFHNRDYLNLALTPEGTRKPVDQWKTGFLYISYGAKVPIELGIIDYAEKKVVIKDEFNPSGNLKEDMIFVRKYYSSFKNSARYPKNFNP